MRPRLVVARHGDTEWSRVGRHTGRSDLPLDPSGRAQAQALEPRLSKASFAAVWTSPLIRARETCALAGFGDVAEVRDDLREWDYGLYEGRTTSEIRQQRPGWSLWFDGVPDGETIDQVAARAERVVGEARRCSGDVLVFAHGHLLRVLAARWLGRSPDLGSTLVLGPATLSVLGWERENPAIVLWNDPGRSVLEI